MSECSSRVKFGADATQIKKFELKNIVMADDVF